MTSSSLGHGNSDQTARPGKFDRGLTKLVTVRRECRDIREVKELFHSQQLPQAGLRFWTEYRHVTKVGNKGVRRAVRSTYAQGVALAQPEMTEFGIANADCILQYRIEDRCQFTW